MADSHHTVPNLPGSLERQLDGLLGVPPGERTAALEKLCRENSAHSDQLYALFHLKGLGTATGRTRPDAIGPYRILDTLGEGGMGTVYLAEQREPIRRRVALKVIKLGMDSERVLRRFEAERQALAMMEHGNIAKVFEAGTTDRGQPYFVMEYVKGIPITQHCDQHNASIEDRINLFCQVCSGVEHAHQKGVMHRDLKPSNVLVTLQEGKAVPKIIDFGLARATDHRLVQATLCSEQGLIIGTPEYMSPEQAGLGGQDVDTRTDVYSLGVLLYELLVGDVPFSPDELRQAGLAEMERKIKEDEPPRPSTKLFSLGDTREVAARRRRTDTRSLLRRLRTDLDWVVMKALEKDRTRRYSTPDGLAEDLRRHLHHEPVSAGPPSTRYRLRKLARRYRAQVITGALVLTILVAGIVSFAVENARANEKALEASAEKQIADDQRDLAVAKEAEAKRNLQIALQAVDRFLRRLGSEELVYMPLMQSLGESFVQDAVEFYEKLLEEGARDPDLRIDYAEAHRNLAWIYGVRGENRKALETLERSMALLGELQAEGSETVETRIQLALAQNDLGNTYRKLGRQEEGRRALESSLSLYQGAIRERPEDGLRGEAIARNSLGTLLMDLGELQDAERQLRPALELFRQLEQQSQDERDDLYRVLLAHAHNSYALLSSKLNRVEEAVEHLIAAEEICEPFLSAGHRSPSFRLELARTLNRHANIDEQQGRFADALSRQQRAVALAEGLVGDHPDDIALRRSLAQVLSDLGNTTGQARAEAEAAFTRARSILAGICAANPTDWLSAFEYARLLRRMAGRLTTRATVEQAEALLSEAVELASRALQGDSVLPEHRMELARCLNDRGIQLLRLGRAAEAEAVQLRARDIKERLVRSFPERIGFRASLASSYHNLGRVFLEQGERDRAQEMYELAIQEKSRILEQAPDSHEGHYDLALSLHNLAGIHLEASRIDEAREILEQALQEERLAIRGSPRPDYRRQLANTCEALSWTLLPSGDHERVVTLAEEMRGAEPGRPTTTVRAAVLVSRAVSSLTDADLAPQDRVALEADYADRAMDWIRSAVSAGYRNREELQNNPRLAPLRSREGFQKILDSIRQ